MISGLFTYDGKFLWDMWVSTNPFMTFSDSVWSPNSKRIALYDGWNDKISILSVNPKKILTEIDPNDLISKHSFSNDTWINKMFYLE